RRSLTAAFSAGWLAAWRAGVTATAATSAAASATSTASDAGARFAGARIRTRDAAAWLGAELAFGHDLIAGMQPRRDHDIRIGRLTCLDRTLLDGLILLDEEHELAVLPGLDRFGRNDRRIGQDSDA